MKKIRLLLSLVACLAFTNAPAFAAKDAVRVVLVSKVEAAKSKLRDKGATEWMLVDDLKKLNEEKKAKNQQIIFFEYHMGKDKWRGVYTDKVQLPGYSWWTIYGEHEMEAKVNEQMAAGLKPAFISRSGNYYSMLFVPPDQYDAARKALDELGVGVPKLK